MGTIVEFHLLIGPLKQLSVGTLLLVDTIIYLFIYLSISLFLFLLLLLLLLLFFHVFTENKHYRLICIAIATIAIG